MSAPVDTPAFSAARIRLAGRFAVELLDPWWSALPATLSWAADAWDLAFGEPVGHGETAVVLPATRRGSGDRAYLKLTPDPVLSEAEARALDRWATTGRVPVVLERSVARGALLLSALPGASVREAGGVPSLEAVAALVRDLHGVPPAAGTFAPLAERVDFLFELWDRRLRGAAPGRAGRPPAGQGGPHRGVDADAGLLARGRRLAAALSADAPVPLVIHGDLHPGNVFDVGGAIGLAALDPRPCVGDAGFDLVDWILWGTDEPSVWRANSDRLAALTGTAPDRAWAWCTAFAAMLAALEATRGGSARRVASLLEIAA